MRTNPAPLITRRAVVGKLDTAKVMRLLKNPNEDCRHVRLPDLIEWTRFFTDRSVARKNAGKMNQSMLHLLKLYFRLDIEQDGKKHCKDIASWVYEIRRDWLKDESKNRIEDVFKWYKKEEDIYNKIPKWERTLQGNYHLKENLKSEQVDDAGDKLVKLLKKGTKDEMKDFLQDEYLDLKAQSQSHDERSKASDKLRGKKKR